MKKLIIAAVIVCAAVMSQAAQVRWRASGVLGVDKTSYTGAATLFAVLTDAKEIEDPVSSGSFGGSMSSGTINTPVDVSSLTVGAVYTFYYTMTDTKGNVFTSTSYPGVQIQANSTPTLQFGSGGAWAAPEPTSGLLLLVGLGALALRRRRA